jgi:hypothetical protein
LTPTAVPPSPTTVATQLSQLPDPTPTQNNQNRVESDTGGQSGYVPLLLGVFGLGVVVFGAWWLLGRRDI